MLLFRQRRQVSTDLLHHGFQLNLLVPGQGLEAAHFQQGFGHLGQPLHLLFQGRQEGRCFRHHLRMLGREKLQLGLHQCQRRAQLMSGIAGKLLLGGKGTVQPLQHLIKGTAQLAKLRQSILIDAHVCQIVHLYFFYLSGKGAEGLQCPAADKVSHNAAEEGNCRRDVPVGCPEAFLRIQNHNGQFLMHAGIRVKGDSAIGCVVLYGSPDGIHVVVAGKAHEQHHGNAGYTNQEGRQQGNAPLQGKPLHGSSPPMT